MSIEKINYEPKIKNPEKEILNIEKSGIPEQKFVNLCEDMGKNPEFLNKICINLEEKLSDGLKRKGINFQAILEKNNLQIEKLA